MSQGRARNIELSVPEKNFRTDRVSVVEAMDKYKYLSHFSNGYHARVPSARVMAFFPTIWKIFLSKLFVDEQIILSFTTCCEVEFEELF